MNKRVEILGMVKFPGVDGARTVSHVLEHPVKDRDDLNDHADFMADRNEHAESYLRQYVASVLEIEVVSVEVIE